MSRSERYLGLTATTLATAASRKLRLGIMGCGAVCQQGHIPTILNNDHWIVHSLYDPQKENLLTAQKKARAPHAFTDAKSFFNSGIEAIAICSPAPHHCQNVLDACKYRLPILCEKPLAMTESEGRKMIAAANKAGIKLFVGFDYRFSVVALKIRELIRAGAIGEPRALRLIYVWNNHGKWTFDAHGKKIPNQHRSGRMNEGGPLVDCGVHQIDLARWWLNSEVERWTVNGAWVDEYTAADHLWLHLDHTNGAHTLVEISYSFGHVVKEPVSFFTYQIIGTGGLIQYQREQKVFELRTPSGTQELEWAEEKNFGWMYDAFAHAIITGDNGDVLAMPEDGLIATKIAREATEKATRFHRHESADIIGAISDDTIRTQIDGMHQQIRVAGQGVVDRRLL